MYYFVGGYARTGTTLIGSLLCGDPRTNDPIAEVTYLEYLMFPYEAFVAGWESNNRGLFDSEDEFWEFHRGMLERFLVHLRVKHSCEHLVVKRPFLTRWFPTLAQMFEDAHFVICVRDPRDVIGSMKVVQRRHFELDAEKQALNPYLNQTLLEFCYGYSSAIKICLEHAREFKDRFHFVQYEELVKNPEESMATIGEVLGLELGFVEDHWKIYTGSNIGRMNPFHSKGWGNPITSANIGKYKSQLTGEEVAMVELVCAIIMEGFGYERDNRNLEGGTRGL